MGSKNQDRPHGDHRKRMRARVLKDGCESLTDCELLEMLLYYAVAQANTTPMAEELLGKYGSIGDVLEMKPGEVSKISGLKDMAEVLFALLREANARSNGSVKNLLSNRERLEKFLINLFKGAGPETVFALFFSPTGELIERNLIHRGNINSAQFKLRTLTEVALRVGATMMVLAHNHPSGMLIPSTDDIVSTNRMAIHLSANGIELIDHFLVNDDECVGILNP